VTTLPPLSRLHVSLDLQLPAELAVGAGTALFVAGTCYCPSGAIRDLSLFVDGIGQPVLAHGMPRLDFFAELHPSLDPYQTTALTADPDSPDDVGLRSYHSGFWAIAKVMPGRSVHELALRARLDNEEVIEAELARIESVELERPTNSDSAAWPEGVAQQRVAICMATYNPPGALFRAQIESIRAQTHRNWICFISDDRSSDEVFARLLREIDGDQRFVVSRSPRRRGFFNNFERALTMAPADADFVAMADQDDRWYPEKLETLLAAIGGAQLAYSDARIVSRDSKPIADTYWADRRNNHSSMLSLLVANSVTGAASLLRRDVLDYALPFPPAQFAHFHDHWVGLTARALGEIVFVDRPLYDYVQHGEASLGHAAATQMTSLRDRLRRQRPLRDRVRMWRLHYFVDVCRLATVATILELRCSQRIAARDRRALQRFLASENSLGALSGLALRGGRELLRATPETLGAEWMLAHAFFWRRLLSATVRERPQHGLRLDAVPPPSLAMKPGRAEVVSVASELADKIAPLELAVSDTAPERINVLIPSMDLKHLFGGYIAKLNLAKRLAQSGHRVRLVTVDPVGALPPNWQREIEEYAGLDRLFDAVEVEFGRGPAPVELSPRDGFIATTWWTAHIAAAALSESGGKRFVYLIQEYEPFTFPMGTYAALAAQSYTFEHFALFSSEFLRDYFRRHRIGVYSVDLEAGDRESVAFENAITAVQAPGVADLAQRPTRRLLFYARPESHAARNMFELGALALAQAIEKGVFAGWDLHGIGTVQGGRTIPLGAGAALELLPRSEQSTYGQLLRDHDVGLALMYTPHPSLVPIEMASAGMLTVTNSFENKTADGLAAISPNIITAEPTVDAVADALTQAAMRVTAYDARVAGSQVRWSSEWTRSFDDSLLARVVDVFQAVGALT